MVFLGMVIREIGSLWQVSLVLSLVNELLAAHKDMRWENPESIGALDSDICNKYIGLVQKAEHYGITECYRWKTMLDVSYSAIRKDRENLTRK